MLSQSNLPNLMLRTRRQMRNSSTGTARHCGNLALHFVSSLIADRSLLATAVLTSTNSAKAERASIAKNLYS